MTSCCPRHRMRWSGATGAIARCKNRSTGYARRDRSVHAWRWICGVKPKPKAVNKPSPPFIVHGLDKPGGFTTVSGKVAETTNEFLGVRGWHIGDDKSLLLCQEHSRTFSGRCYEGPIA